MTWSTRFVVVLLVIQGCSSDRYFLYNAGHDSVTVASSNEFSADNKNGPWQTVMPHALKQVDSHCKIFASGKGLYYVLQWYPSPHVGGEVVRYDWDRRANGLALPTYDFVFVLDPEGRIFLAPDSFREVIQKGGTIDSKRLASLPPTKDFPIPGYPTTREASEYSVGGNRYTVTVQNDSGVPVHHLAFADAAGWPVEDALPSSSTSHPITVVSDPPPRVLSVSWQDDDGNQHSKRFDLHALISRPELFSGAFTVWFAQDSFMLWIMDRDFEGGCVCLK